MYGWLDSRQLGPVGIVVSREVVRLQCKRVGVMTPMGNWTLTGADSRPTLLYILYSIVFPSL